MAVPLLRAPIGVLLCPQLCGAPLRDVLLQSVESSGELGQRERGREAVSDSEVWLLLLLAPLLRAPYLPLAGHGDCLLWSPGDGALCLDLIHQHANLCALHPLRWDYAGRAVLWWFEARS